MDQKAAPPLHEQHARYQPAAAVRELPVPVSLDPAMRAARETVSASSTWIRPLQQEMARVIVGQRHLLDRLLIAMLTNGHVLLEGVPGLAKTLALKTLASCISVQFKRLQFTPDMLPADIVGTMIYSPQDGEFRTKHGPIFSNLILADEINRAPAKVQSALLEAMQERTLDLCGCTVDLVRQDEIAEYRPMFGAELAVLRAINHGADDVGGQHVRRKLQPLELHGNATRQGLQSQSLRKTGDTLQEHVTV